LLAFIEKLAPGYNTKVLDSFIHSTIRVWVRKASIPGNYPADDTSTAYDLVANAINFRAVPPGTVLKGFHL